MLWLIAIPVCLLAVLLLSVVGFLLSWLIWFAQLWIVFITIPYYAGRALVAFVRWAHFVLTGRKAEAKVEIFPPRGARTGRR